MPTLKVHDVVDATRGRLLRGDPEAVVHSFAIDTRELERDSGFVALRGSRTDGHEYLAQAARGGAALALVERDLAADTEAPASLIQVDDCATALGRCGALARERIGDAKVVAVAGSTGKTTTKELIAEGLAADGTTHKTAGNRNNHLGVPLTLLACPDGARFVVVEIGMSGFGEVGALSKLARPNVGVVTNVAPEHMEFFRTLDDVAAAEGELYGVLEHDAVSVVNADDVQARIQGTRHAGRQVTFGTSESVDVRMVSVDARLRPGTTIRLSVDGAMREVRLRYGGKHAAWNALAALAAVYAAGGNLERAGEAISRLEPGPGRGRVHELPDDVVLVDDSYNSSPAALATVLDMIAAETTALRRVCVLGDMLEMGADAAVYHHEAGRRVAAARVGLLIGVGPLARAALETARRAGVAEAYHVRDAEAAADMLLDLLRPGDLVVVKGSRGVGLDRTVRRLLAARSAGDM